MKLVILLVAGGLAGCAISERAYSRIASGVSRRNEQRYLAAEEDLRARGYVFADDELLYATMPEEARRRCQRGDLPHGEPAEPVRLSVAPASRADRPLPVPIEVRIGAAEACPFFAGRTDRIDGQKPDGSAVPMVRIPDGLRLARDRRGEWVLIDAILRVVSRRSVRVERTCDHMPHPVNPFEGLVSARLLLVATTPARVEMVVPKEELDVKCTVNTY